MSQDIWSKEQLDSIRKMLYPKSIAVIGASERNRYGERFLNAVLRSKDRVRIYPINPNHKEMKGVPCFPSVADLPEAPDLVALLVPQSTVIDTLKACHQKGAGAAIVVSGGFAERGTETGRELQREIGRLGRETGMRICGPNCLGVANVKDNIWSTATSKNPSGLTGHIGLVCQSGATAYGPFVAQAADNGFGFSHIISSGNETDLEFADYVRFLLDDTDTHVIGGFVEGFKDVRKLIAVAELAAERGKPIVLVKIGRSESGSRAAASHTASLTGSDAAYDALFRQCGIIRVNDYAELLQVSNYLVHSKKPKQRGVAVVSNSGGISSLTADSLGNAGIDLPALTERAHSGISDILKNAGWAANPADVTGFASSDHFPRIMDLLIEEPTVGTLVIASQAVGNRVTQAEQVVSLHQRSDKNVNYLWIAGRRDESGLAILKNANVPVFYAPEDLARTLKTVGDFEERHRNRSAAAPELPPLSASQNEVVARLKSTRDAYLSESDSKKILAAWDVRAPAERLCTSAPAAVAAAEKIGFPVVLKVDTPDVPHKTEADVVRLGLRSAADVTRAYEEIMANAVRHAPKAKINGVMVQEMVTGGVEVIIGISYDAQIGPMLLFGIGGVMVEIYKDVALRRCPISRADAANMISEVKGAKLLQGFRGRPPADIEALMDALVQISRLAVHLAGHLSELDINPLAVLPAGQGVKALDALAVVRK